MTLSRMGTAQALGFSGWGTDKWVWIRRKDALRRLEDPDVARLAQSHEPTDHRTALRLRQLLKSGHIKPNDLIQAEINRAEAVAQEARKIQAQLAHHPGAQAIARTQEALFMKMADTQRRALASDATLSFFSRSMLKIHRAFASLRTRPVFQPAARRAHAVVPRNILEVNA